MVASIAGSIPLEELGLQQHQVVVSLSSNKVLEAFVLSHPLCIPGMHPSQIVACALHAESCCPQARKRHIQQMETKQVQNTMPFCLVNSMEVL